MEDSPNMFPELPLAGGCQCGQLRYTVTKMPTTLYCCHCTECQGQSSSAFGMSLRVVADGVTLEGDVGAFVRDKDTERAVECVFCPQCGSRILHRGRGADAGSSIKAGSLDNKTWLQPVGHIWAASAQKWMTLNGLIYQGQPANYDELEREFARVFGIKGPLKHNR